MRKIPDDKLWFTRYASEHLEKRPGFFTTEQTAVYNAHEWLNPSECNHKFGCFPWEALIVLADFRLFCVESTFVRRALHANLFFFFFKKGLFLVTNRTEFAPIGPS